MSGTCTEDQDEFDTPEDLARRLKVSVRTVYAWNLRGTGPCIIRIGKRVRYRRTDVDRWIAGRTELVS